MAAPADGTITMTHFLPPSGSTNTGSNSIIISTKPVLVLGAQQDIIYPPDLLREDFQRRFPNATHVTVPHQAHCFMDPPPQPKTPTTSTRSSTEKKLQLTMEDCLLEWLDEL
jgi:pimeloyl-ACP methyl ester carboxylesterase